MPSRPLRLATLAVCALVLGHAPAFAAEKKREEQKVQDASYPIEFRKRVNSAIKDGVRWLKVKQLPNGSWADRHNGGYPMGPTALATLTLLKSGVPRDAPCIQRAFTYLRAQKMARTYSVGILLMALDAKYAPARDPFAVDATDRYGNITAKKDPCAEAISKKDKAWMKEGVDFLLKHQTADGVWRYPSAKGFDLSNTQYALLGLQAATRCAVKVKPRVWLDALRYLLEHQDKVGPPVLLKCNEVRGRYRFEWTEPSAARGFRYVKGICVSGSMTTAGLAGLIICKGALWKSRSFNGKLRAQTRDGIRDAIAWMQKHFSVTENPIVKEKDLRIVGAQQHYYYLYGMERAGILGKTRYFGTIDWYYDGALYLLDKQDVEWLTPGTLVSSCFAVLFLKRATTRMNIPVITPRANDAK